jgi:lipid II:glycine glycyltransferase (peptidoglycan interpeptide bridge formation enzyme)
MKLSPISESDYRGNASFLQSGFWGAHKSSFGWRPFYFNVEEAQASGLGNGSLLALERKLGCFFSFAYIPYAPAFRPSDPPEDALHELIQALRPFLSPLCIFVRFDLPWELESAGGREKFLGKPLSRSGYDVQPPDTVILDLGKSEEELLEGMKPKWRYNVRLAEKKGVRVQRENDIDSFYEMYKETASRDKISIHSKEYYLKMLDAGLLAGVDSPKIMLLIARHGGEAIAGIIVALYGGRAVYLYGASSDKKRNFMPAYALQWEAIRAAKEAGCTEYDFFGIPPSEAPAHPMAGLYRFKTGFGGKIVHRAGSWDFPLRKYPYAAYRRAEALRAFWHKKVKKLLLRKARIQAL